MLSYTTPSWVLNSSGKKEEPGSYIPVLGGYILVPGGYIPVPGDYIQVPAIISHQKCNKNGGLPKSAGSRTSR